MSLLDSLSRGWYGGWAELPEVGAGASGLLARLYPGEEEDPFEKLKKNLNLTAEEWRDKGPEGESTGLLEKIAEGIGAAPGTVASMAPFLAATAGTGGVGAIAGAAAGMGLHGLVRHGDEDLREAAGYGLKGAAEGALFGAAGAWAGKYAPKAAQGLMRKQLQAATPEEKLALQPMIDAALHTSAAQAIRRARHAGAAGGVVGGMGLVHGQSVEDAAAGAASMGLLGALGGMTPKQIAEGGMYRDPFTSTKKKLDEIQSEVDANYQTMLEKSRATRVEKPDFEAGHMLPDGTIEKTGAIHQAPVDPGTLQPFKEVTSFTGGKDEFVAGFVDKKTGKFYNREEALELVRGIKKISDQKGLGSEDLMYDRGEIGGQRKTEPSPSPKQDKEPWEMTKEEWESRFPRSQEPVEFSGSLIKEDVYHGSPSDSIEKFFTDQTETGANTGAKNTALGAFFSESPDVARIAAYGFSPEGAFYRDKMSLYTVKLNLKNPLNVDNLSAQERILLEKEFPGFNSLYDKTADKLPVLKFFTKSRAKPSGESMNFKTYANQRGITDQSEISRQFKEESGLFPEWKAREDSILRSFTRTDAKEKLKRLGYDGIIVKTEFDTFGAGPKKQYVVFDPENASIIRKQPVYEHRVDVEIALQNKKDVPFSAVEKYPDLIEKYNIKRPETEVVSTEQAPASDMRAAGMASRPHEMATDTLRQRLADISSAEARRAVIDFHKEKGPWVPRDKNNTARRAAENIFRDEKGNIKASPEDLDAMAWYLDESMARTNQRISELERMQEDFIKAGDTLSASRVKQDIDAEILNCQNDYAQFLGVRSTAGNTMLTLKKIKRNTPEWIAASEKLKKTLGVNADRVVEMLRMSRDNPELIAKITRAVDTPSLWDQFQEYWINGLLSGPPTHLVNISSNALRAGIDVVEKGVALAAESRRGIITKAEALGEFQADISAAMQSLGMANRAAMGMLRNEDFNVSSVDPSLAVHQRTSKIDYPSKAIGGTAGKIIRTPGRALQAMDIFFKTVAGERAAASKAYRMATEAIKKGEIQEAQRIEYMAKLRGAGGGEPHPDILAAMKKEGQVQTFTEQLPPQMAGFEKIRQTDVLGTKPVLAVVPFLSTPFNVIKQSLMRSPLGLLAWKKLNADYEAGRITSKEYYQQKAGTLLGTTLTASLVVLAKSGLITGSGPENPQELQNKIATGWRPYSLKVGDAYIPMQRVEPLGTIIGMAGDIAEFGDSEDKMGKMMSIIKDNATDKTFLYGVEALAKAWSEPKQFGSTYYRQMAGSLVPNIVAKGAQAVDPYARDVETTGARVGIPDPMAYRIPGLSTALPQRQTALGEPAERWGVYGTANTTEKVVSGIQSFLNPSPVSSVRPNTEVEQELDRLSKEPGMPPSVPRKNKQISLRGVNGESVKLTDDEFAIYDKHHENAKRQLAMIIQAPAYRMMQDEQKAKLLRSIYDKHREMANREINMRVRRRTTVGN